jgi:hypothetical protein
MTIASYSGTCTFEELDNLTGIRRASLELLQKMGVEPTARTRTALTQAATANQVNAQTALAQGIASQRSGTVVESLNYYYQAAAFDPALLEAANRASVISTAITSGNIGENVRNDIQRRNEWIKILREADNFYRQHLPYEIIYDPTLIQGRTDYGNSTVELSIRLAVVPIQTAFNVIGNLVQGLYNTGKSVEWGLDKWPLFAGTANQMEISSLPGRWAEYNYYVIPEVTIALKNQNGKMVGEVSCDIPYSKPGAGRGQFTIPNSGLYTVMFRGVKADDITDRLTVSFVSINGISTENLAGTGLEKISTGSLPSGSYPILNPVYSDRPVGGK